MKPQWQPRRFTALIAEDEPMLRAQLRTRLLQAWPELAIVAEAENGEQALALAAELEPEIAFLDIRMPVKDGLDVAAAIGDRCHVVFVTAYDEYAVHAFEQGAVDYVLKPVTAERVVKLVDRLKQRLAAPPADLASGCAIPIFAPPRTSGSTSPSTSAPAATRSPPPFRA